MMNQERPINLSILSIERKISKDINFFDLGKFIKIKTRKHVKQLQKIIGTK